MLQVIECCILYSNIKAPRNHIQLLNKRWKYSWEVGIKPELDEETKIIDPKISNGSK